ncbi:MAG: hypothetical protein ABSB59_24060 [Streptosporangiaceae bacterium]
MASRDIEVNPLSLKRLFANKPERHRKEVPDSLQFRSMRNQFGALVLLPASDNASFGAMPLDEKVVRYGRQNVLVGVLNRDYHRNFVGLREFAKENQVEAFLRPFSPKASMAEITDARQNLYLRLCARIWSISHIGLKESDLPSFRDPFAVSAAATDAPVVDKVKPKTDLARMVAAGILSPGTRIVLSYRDRDYWAVICPDGRVRLEATGAVYTNVNDAGCLIRETRTCDGMKFWCVLDEDGTRISLRARRDAAREAGTLTARRR